MPSGSTTFDKVNKVWTTPARDNVLPEGMCLGQLILRQLDKLPSDKVIEVHYDNREESTVEKVRQLSISCARSLTKLGVQKGDVVVLFTLLNSQITPTIFGCYIIGAVINPFETNFSDEDTDYTLTNLNPTVILYDSVFSTRIESAVKRLTLPKLRHIIPFGTGPNTVAGKLLEDTLGAKDSFQPPQLGHPDDTLAALLLTSGSTGLPKAIQISQTLLLHGVYTWWSTTPTSRIYIASPLRWISQVSAMLQPVFLGSIRVTTGMEPSAAVCTQLIKDMKVTHFFGVPGLFFGMLEHAKLFDPTVMDSLELVISGGEVVSEALSTEVRQVLPDCKFAKGYGMTELAGLIASDEQLPGKNVNGGEIKPGMSLEIVDDDLQTLGANECGQICVKYPFPFMRYYNNADANVSAFLPNGWFNTGDFGQMDEDDHLNVLGRYKDIVRCDGKLIIPSNLELIVNTHAIVAVSIVVGIPHKDVEKGEMAAVFVQVQEANRRGMNDSQIKIDILEYVNSNVPQDQQPLGGIFLIEKFPLTTCGKINKIALKQIAQGNKH